ncbi:MAG: SnoaL-like domain-containing protein [Rhodobacteraceae bacterium]|nr:ester cyclase [Alphaproteobacteria bacterium]NNK65599.1 SnoaL-like domain-containing protein [Paracoccaceae bacterium]
MNETEARRVLDPLAGFDGGDLGAAFARVLSPGAAVHLAFPFETMVGPEGLADAALVPLASAFPDLERRETIRMAGRDAAGAMWVGVCGAWVGTFAAPFLGIPPTRRAATMRFHEFFRIEEGRAVEMQALWDIPELMMQARAWPMAPSLGREWRVPGPRLQDGLRIAGDGARALEVVGGMLAGLSRSHEGVAAMELDRFWHPDCAWYGPSSIGSTRGIDGFRAHHQAPFLAAMPDRRAFLENGHFFAEGDFVGFTAWPGMAATLTGGGWLGLPGAGQEITMRSLDFWRVEGDLIRENWVLVDLLHVYDQLGVDVLARMRELIE